MSTVLKCLSILVVAICLCSPGAVCAEGAYTLDDLFRIALERAEQVKISEENLFIAEREKDKAVSALLPRISAFGDYTRYREKKSFSGPAGSFSVQPESSSSWGLVMQQSVSLGGKEVIALDIAKKGIESSRYNADAVREAYIFRIAEAYYDVLKAMKAVEIAHANVQRLRKYRDEAEIKLKVGEVSKTALLRAEAELSGAQSGLVRAENILLFAKAVLARLSGIDEDFVLKEPVGRETGATKDTIAMPVHDLQSPSSLKDEAMRERAEVKSLGLQKKIAGQQVRYAKGSYLPILSFEGIYSRRDENPSSSFLNDETVYGALRLDFPLFEGGVRRAEVREAEAKKRQSEMLYEDMKKTVGIEVENAFLDARTQAGILKSLEDQARFARENYDAVSKQFEFGLATSIDVIDANTLLVDSERELTRAEYDYHLAILRLKRSTGTLLKTVIKDK